MECSIVEEEKDDEDVGTKGATREDDIDVP